ncbi:uncharacterized protein [Nicotiana tomentosiformis]|uniref:uncharacterized protein n=1 Tax=Nicotiana tomentosiformis TaxID=4098 RepID=UPI00388CE592
MGRPVHSALPTANGAPATIRPQDPYYAPSVSSVPPVRGAISGIDWLSPYHVILDCHSKTLKLAMPGLPLLEWRGTLGCVPSRVISFHKDQRMVEKGCDEYLAYVRDVGVDTLAVESVPIVRDYSDVFLSYLLGMPPDRDIDFGIDLLPFTQPISIPPYRMAPVELKELKEQLRELLDKGFIRPSVSS